MTIRLDNTVIEFFRAAADRAGGGNYQSTPSGPLPGSHDSPTIALMDHLSRITIDGEIRLGKPSVRATRMTARDVLSYLASGMSQGDITRSDLEPVRVALEANACAMLGTGTATS